MSCRVESAGGAAYETFCIRLRSALDTRPYAVVISGVQLDEHSFVLATVCSAIGVLVDPYNQPWSTLIRDIRPHDAGAALTEALHSDSTDWPEPNDYTALACIRPDRAGGGRSRIIDVDTIIANILSSMPETSRRALARPAPWRLAEALGGSLVNAPILAGSTIRWMKHTIDVAVHSGGAHLERDAAGAIDEFEARLAETGLGSEFLLAANEILIVNNKRCLHGRTAIEDRHVSDRLLKRVKIQGRWPPRNAKSGCDHSQE